MIFLSFLPSCSAAINTTTTTIRMRKTNHPTITIQKTPPRDRQAHIEQTRKVNNNNSQKVIKDSGERDIHRVDHPLVVAAAAILYSIVLVVAFL